MTPLLTENRLCIADNIRRVAAESGIRRTAIEVVGPTQNGAKWRFR